MMKLISRLLIAVALLTTGSFALAAPGQGDHNRQGQDHNRGNHGDNGRHDNRRGHDNRHYDGRRHDDRRYGYGYRHDGPRHVGHPRWERGHRYYGPTYVVRNYGYYRLRPPPYGYHWVRADNDYLLVAIATGVILDMALH